MRFVLGPIPPSETFDAKAAGWTPMVSSADLPLTKVISLVGMIGFILAGYWCLPQVIISMEMSSRLKIAALAAIPFFLMIPLHEFCHCLGYLVPLTSRSLISGMWLRQGFYIAYDSPLQKIRVLLMLAAPFALLSILPAFTILFLSPAYFWVCSYIVLIHAALCVGDAVTFYRILVNVPRGGWVHNCGWTTCWSTISPESVAR
jgi:Putative zincin peptidase